MSNELEYLNKQCPYCGEIIEVQIDISAGSQIYYEDCYVCCRPIKVNVRLNASLEVELNTDSA